jgi:cation diffusion facilitator CzcD-associated flavoprotein CzcO
MVDCDVTIIGAGPYGLAAGNRLRRIKGLDVRVLGDPMSFWKRSMPTGMFLRSNWTATQIADQDGQLSLEHYAAECGNHLSAPVPVTRFVQYGEWYQRKSLPDVDRRKVIRVERDPAGFRLTLEDGEQLISRRVVVSAGISAFAYRPAEFDGFPADLASHTSNHSDLGKFAAKEVLVVGGGQSALESAALLHEAGATVEVVARSPRIHWLQGWASRTLHHGLGELTNKLLYAPTDVGPAGISQLMARPDALRRLPRRLQDKLRARSIRPAGARWLVDRLRDVPVHLQRTVASAAVSGERVRVRLDDGTERNVDHVLLATGYRVDINKYSFLAPDILKSIRVFNGFPILREGLETSIPGLHILGAPGSWSFGPLLMFVSGTHYATRALAQQMTKGLSLGRSA